MRVSVSLPIAATLYLLTRASSTLAGDYFEWTGSARVGAARGPAAERALKKPINEKRKPSQARIDNRGGANAGGRAAVHIASPPARNFA